MANEKKITSAPIAAKTDKSETKVKALDGKSAVNPHSPSISARRLGFMAGQISVPDDFDQMGSEKIEQIFSDRVLKE